LREVPCNETVALGDPVGRQPPSNAPRPSVGGEKTMRRSGDLRDTATSRNRLKRIDQRQRQVRIHSAMFQPHRQTCKSKISGGVLVIAEGSRKDRNGMVARFP